MLKDSCFLDWPCSLKNQFYFYSSTPNKKQLDSRSNFIELAFNHTYRFALPLNRMNSFTHIRLFFIEIWEMTSTNTLQRSYLISTALVKCILLMSQPVIPMIDFRRVKELSVQQVFF